MGGASGVFGWFSSAFVHAMVMGLALLFMAGSLGQCSKPLAMSEESNVVPIDVISMSDFSNISALSPNPTIGPEQPNPEGSPQPTAPDEEVEPIPDPNAKPKPKDKKPKAPSLADLQKTLQDLSKDRPGKSSDPTSSKGALADKPRACVGPCDKLSASEHDLLIAQLEVCWRGNRDQADPSRTKVSVRFQLNRDGSLRGKPTVVAPSFISPGDLPLQVAARNAVNAVNECAPFKGFRPERYNYWRIAVGNFGASGVE